MELDQEQQGFRDGEAGLELELAIRTLIRYGEAFGATRLVPIVSSHLAGSFAIVAYSGYFECLDRLVAAGIRVRVPTTVNPHPGCEYSLQNRWIAFRKQEHHERQLQRLGVTPNYSCVCYCDANIPRFGEVVGWAESSAVIYANSVLGARTNRNSIMIDVCMAITGWTPDFGLTRDENRKGHVLVKLDIERMDPPALGYLVGQRVVSGVPVLTHYPFDRTELKNMGGAMAAAGGIGLFHVLGVTPEAPTMDAVFDREPDRTITITQRDLDALRLERGRQESASLVVLGCPQMTLEEVQQVGQHFVGKRVTRRTLFHLVPSALSQLRELPLYDQLIAAGVELFGHCPLASLSLRWGGGRVLSPSGKLHYYLEDGDYGSLEDVLRLAGVG